MNREHTETFEAEIANENVVCRFHDNCDETKTTIGENKRAASRAAQKIGG